MMLIELLQNKEGFTETERNLSDYILSHVDTVKEMTVRKLAEAAYVSPPAVSRLCQKAGMKGWGDFRVRLATECTEAYREMIKVDSNFPFKPEDSSGEIVDKLAQLTIRHILAAKENIDFSVMNQAADAICSRRTIDIYGEGMSLTSAEEFAEKVLRIGHPAVIIKGNTEQYYHSVTSTPDQFAIVISYSGRLDFLIKTIKSLRKRHTPTLLITGNRLSPMIRYANYTSYIHSAEELEMKLKMERFGVQTAIHFILDTLYAHVFLRNYTKNIASVKEQGEHEFL